MICNSDGEVVCYLKIFVSKGLKCMIWDMCYDIFVLVVGCYSFLVDVFFGLVELGYLVWFGEYMVVLSKYVDGELISFMELVSFWIKYLN